MAADLVEGEKGEERQYASIGQAVGSSPQHQEEGAGNRDQVLEQPVAAIVRRPGEQGEHAGEQTSGPPGEGRRRS